jgi:ABC-type multidrug transport system ATPase subunit
MRPRRHFVGAVTPVLRADSIGKRFGGRAVLHAATLRAEAGHVAYLVGGNGCGKTTLLRIVAGEVAADHGVVIYKGAAHLRPRWSFLARDGFFYLPDRDLLAPSWTVRRHLEEVVAHFGRPGYAEAVAACALTPLLERVCASLSSGERRRSEVAIAVARRPDCLLADEPYRNLDPADRAILARTFRMLAGSGCAVVVTGHEIEDLFATADSLVWCTDGTTYELGPPCSALREWRFVRDYLGPGRAAELEASMGCAGG